MISNSPKWKIIKSETISNRHDLVELHLARHYQNGWYMKRIHTSFNQSTAGGINFHVLCVHNNLHFKCVVFTCARSISLNQLIQLIHFFVHKLWAHFLSTFLLLSAFDINKTSHWFDSNNFHSNDDYFMHACALTQQNNFHLKISRMDTEFECCG